MFQLSSNPQANDMHVEKIRGEFWVLKGNEKVAGPFQLRDTAIAEMRKLAKRFFV